MTDTPFDRAFSRRAFLGGIAAAGGLLIANTGSVAAAEVSTTKLVPLVLSEDLYVSSTPQRLVFALATGGKGGIKFASGPSTQLRLEPPNGTWTPLVTTTFDKAGLPKGRGVYLAAPTLDVPGVWRAEARASGQKITFAIQVNATPATVVPGQPAPRAASPTPAAPLGVDPICTRQPMCPLHTVSLANVIGAGKPVAALFATPARCQSQYCGPVLDELLTLTKQYQDRMTFVHIEIYKSLTSPVNDHVPTVDAWKLPGEPMLFGIDATGTVVSRLDGAFGGNEMKKLLDALGT